MRCIVYGATGYTGRLVAEQALRSGADVVLAGRDPDRLAALAARWDVATAVAAADDSSALQAAFRGRDVVLNCAGPFTRTGHQVIAAALATGAHYLDTAGEQHFVHEVFTRHHRTTTEARVAVVPGAANDGLPGDLLAHLVAAGRPVRRLDIAYRLDAVALTRGSVRSAVHSLRHRELQYRDSAWQPAPRSVRRPPLRFTDQDRPEPTIRLAGLEVVTVPRHVEVRHLDVTVNVAALAPGLPHTVHALLPSLLPVGSALVRTLPPALLDAGLRRLPEGPADEDRSRARVTLSVRAHLENGTTASGTLEVHDVYATTATIAVEVAHHLARGPAATGVLAAAQVLDATTFLQFLGRHGLRWHVDPGTPTRREVTGGDVAER